MITSIRFAACALLAATAAACATTEEVAAPAPAPAPAPRAAPVPATAPAAPALAAARAEGDTLFNTGNCANCHVRGAGPRQAALAMKTHGEIVAALTTGKMMAQGRNLTPEQRAAIATYLTGGGPTG